jgi:broad specificity phosphatase PhoE
MTSIFHLVRHAMTAHVGGVLTGRAPGVGLSEEGQTQAAILAQRLRTTRFESIVSSPRKRARETAALLGDSLSLKPYVSDSIDEIDFGHWSGRSFEELDRDPDWRRWNESRDTASTPGGETMVDVAGRVVGLVDSLRRSHGDGRHVLVTHADVIKAAVCHYLGLPFRHVFDFDIDPASVTVIAVGDGNGIVLARNVDAGAMLERASV